MSTPTTTRPVTETESAEPVRPVKARRVRRSPADPAAPAVPSSERPTIWALMRGFNPDRRWFHPAQAAVWLYVLAAVPIWAGLPAWTLAVVGVAGTALGVFAARRGYPVRLYGQAQRRNALILTVTAGVMATAWLVFAATVRPTNLIALGALVLGAVLFGGAYALIRTQAPVHRAEVEQQRVERQAEVVAVQEQVEQQRAFNEWEQILADAKLPGLTVREKIDTKAGFTLRLGNHPTEGIRFSDLKEAREKIANTASHRLGLRLSSEQIRPEETDSAAEFLLHVATTNYFATSIPYPLDRPVGTIRKPIRPAIYQDGTDVEIGMLGVHTVMVGGTGGGKSVFTNNVLADCTHCLDNLAWIAASDKLIPLIYPWLFPWFSGMTRRPVIDRVAGEDPKRVLRMLADGYKVAKLRNKRLGPQSKFEPTPQDPAISIFLEEASDLLIDNSTVTIKTFDGKEMNGSQLVNAITRAARSAGVSLYLITQYGLMDALGAHGSFAKRNITQRIAAKTYSAHDGQATLVGMNVDTTKLKNHTILVQPSSDEPRVIPAKAYELDGVDQIAPIAARNTANQPRLPAWLQAELGQDYADRWNPKHLPELFEVMKAQGFDWPSLEFINAGGVDDTFAALMQDALPSGADEKGQEQHDNGQEVQQAVETADDESTGTATAAPSKEEIDKMRSTADQKMDAAIEKFRQWGSLGETMTKVFEVIRAENAPAFVPADRLAFVIDRVEENGDWEAAGRELAAELAGNPWKLETTTQDGAEGWTRQALLDRIKVYLTGEVVVPGQRPAEATAEPMASILAALEGRADDDMVGTGELTVLIGRVTAEDDKTKRTGAAIRLGRELGAAPWFLEAQRIREGSHYRVGELRKAASDVAAGIDRTPVAG
ncbi:hypothetical protein [Actinosynnema sp. NPDC023587]|uniref:hypothetical protein n=1 Tax=Actinosynnema sp. NPDC023587 TaxID=3154695 RepID=UPI0033F3324C